MPEVSSRQERDLFLGRELGQDLLDVKVLVSGRHDGGVWDEVEQYIQYERWRVGDQSESVSNHGGGGGNPGRVWQRVQLWQMERRRQCQAGGQAKRTQVKSVAVSKYRAGPSVFIVRYTYYCTY